MIFYGCPVHLFIGEKWWPIFFGKLFIQIVEPVWNDLLVSFIEPLEFFLTQFKIWIFEVARTLETSSFRGMNSPVPISCIIFLMVE